MLRMSLVLGEGDHELGRKVCPFVGLVLEDLGVCPIAGFLTHYAPSSSKGHPVIPDTDSLAIVTHLSDSFNNLQQFIVRRGTDIFQELKLRNDQGCWRHIVVNGIRTRWLIAMRQCQIELSVYVFHQMHFAINWTIFITQILLLFSIRWHFDISSFRCSTSITRLPEFPISVKNTKLNHKYSKLCAQISHALFYYCYLKMNLKYRVYSVSSESEEHPASALQEMTGIWESDINCSYPQELTVQFYIPIETKNLKLTFHQYKIPRLVEIFVRCGKHEKYRKLGFIQPNDNSQTNFRQKQIKTVYFEFPCTFIKFVFHQNYKNQLNIFDQIALSELIVEGSCLPASELNHYSINVLEDIDTSDDDNDDEEEEGTTIEKSLPVAEKEKKSQTFESILYPEVFEMLGNAKSEAVEREDFQRAAYIKNTVDSFKKMEMEILGLESDKKQALEDEDYDKCHRLKVEISKKKELASFQIKEFYDRFSPSSSSSDLAPNPLAFSKYSQSQPHHQSYITQRSHRIETEEAIQSPKIHRASHVSPNSYQIHEEKIVPALANKGMKKNIEESYYSESKINDSLVIGLKSPGTVKKEDDPYGEQSIDMRTADVRQFITQFDKLEELDFKSLKRYQNYFEYIGPEYWRLALSVYYQRNWQLKSVALDEALSLEVQSGTHICALFELVAITILDNHTTNVKKSLKILQKIIAHSSNKNLDFPGNTLPTFSINTISEALIHLMNDTKQQFRKSAQDIYKNLPQFPFIHLEHIIRILIQSSGLSHFNKNKRKSNARLQLYKIAVIEYFVITYKDAANCNTQIIKWAVQCLNDPNSDVKAGSYKILLLIATRDNETYLRVKEEVYRSDENAGQAFESQFDALMESHLSQSDIKGQQQNNRRKMLTEEDQEYQEDDEQYQYKKQTMKNKRKNQKQKIKSKRKRKGSSEDQSKMDREQVLRKISESPISSPNRMKDSQDVELAYSQESLFQDHEHEHDHDESHSHEWFANNNNNNNEKDIKVMQGFDEDEMAGLCDYCFKQYSEDSLRTHLMETCCVVIRCQFCRGVIYLRELTEHFLTECKKKHQQCPRCLLAFQHDQINDHRAQGICRKSRRDMERCPFCEQDLEADDLAWVEHSEKCQKIVKNPQIEVSLESDDF